MLTATKSSGETIFADRFENPITNQDGFSRRVLDRITYGATPESVAEFDSLGSDGSSRLAAFLDQQLDPASISDSYCEQRIADASYTTQGKPLTQLWTDHVRGNQDRYQPIRETMGARLIRAISSKRQVYEMMVEYWHDHFNVAGWDFSIAPVFVHYDRDVIRPYALGNFRQMLEQVAKSTAMMFYLDNRRSGSGGRFNENFARELLELHTMGAEAYYPTLNPFDVPTDGQGNPLGYCDHDVYEAARCLTGWTIRDSHWNFPDTPEYDTGEYFYFADWHDVAGKTFLREFIQANQPAMLDGFQVFDLLCQHPATARHVCQRLIRRFIADAPPESLVESSAALWLASWQDEDQIAQVMHHILDSAEFMAETSGKLRRPWETTIAAMRKTGADVAPQDLSGWGPWGEFFNRLNATGHGPFRWPSPDGFPDKAERWQATSSLGQSWRLLSRMPQLSDNGQRLLPIREITLQALPASARSANALVDYWLDRIIGNPIDSARRQRLVDFMRQNASATTVLDMEAGDAPYGRWRSNASEHYVGARLFAMVSLIFMLPEFHQR